MISFSVICMSCGNREGISSLPCSTLKSVDAQCSIALLFMSCHVMSFVITRRTLWFFAGGFVNVNFVNLLVPCDLLHHVGDAPAGRGHQAEGGEHLEPGQEEGGQLAEVAVGQPVDGPAGPAGRGAQQTRECDACNRSVVSRAYVPWPHPCQ